MRIVSETPVTSGSGLELEGRVGVAIYPEHGNTPELLLRSADLALETAASQRASFAVYRPEDSKQVTDDWDLPNEIAVGLKNSEFVMYFQPKVDAVTHEPRGAEALLRWDNPRLGQVPPQRVIDAADGTARIDELTRFALHSAARNAVAWPDSNLNIAINLTPSVLESGSIAHEFESVAAIWGIDMSQFTVEITENGIVAADSNALLALNTLRDAGVRVSIDDFGTGNSSLAYLKDIPADELKIDKSFIIDMHHTESNARLVRTIIELAHSFGLTVVAEGVETEAIADTLQEAECDVLQGFYFGRPLPQEEFVNYLLKHQARAPMVQ
jgi:EAL domain-containing protein (putative c-di-GMP-specific phosphodiesterase class I)